MATPPVVIPTDGFTEADRTLLKLTAELVWHVSRTQRQILLKLGKEEQELMATKAEIEQQLTDAVDTLTGEIAAEEGRAQTQLDAINAQLVLLNSNPSAEAVQAQVTKLNALKDQVKTAFPNIVDNPPAPPEPPPAPPTPAP